MRNTHIIINGIIKIQLTQNKFALIDEVCLSRIFEYSWCAKRDKNTWYVVTHIYKPNGCRTTLLIHRLIMGLDFGDSREVDHRDGNGLNNVLNNLHIVDRSGNQHNRHGKSSRKYGKPPTSKHRGICWEEKRCRWRAQIVSNNIHINLGSYHNELEASDVYECAKIIRDAGGTNEEIKALKVSRFVV